MSHWTYAAVYIVAAAANLFLSYAGESSGWSLINFIVFAVCLGLGLREIGKA